MTLPAPVLEMPESVAELEETLRRIRAGVPLRTPNQMLLYCAYLAGTVDAQRGAVQQLSTPGNTLGSSTGVDETILRERSETPPPAPLTMREVYQDARSAFRMDARTAKRALWGFALLVGWYSWWLLFR